MMKFGAIDIKKKTISDNDLICYCFGYSKKEIENDYIDNGRSTIIEKIETEKSQGRCDCSRKNPERR
jgi:hypothetical protein